MFFYSHILIVMTHIEDNNHNSDNCKIGSNASHDLRQLCNEKLPEVVRCNQPMTCQIEYFGAQYHNMDPKGGKFGAQYILLYYMSKNIVFGATKTLYMREISSATLYKSI